MKLQHTALFVIGLMAAQAMAEDPKPAAAPAAAPTPPAVGMGIPSLAAPAASTMPDIQKLSSAIGMSWGDALKQNRPEANLDAVFAAVKDSLAGKPPPLSEQEFRDVMNAFRRASMGRQAEKSRLAAEKNKTDSEAFLAKNGRESGVITLPSGIQYKIITEGLGPIPKSTDVVVVNYRGSTIDGKEFDSSYGVDRKPLTTPVSGRTIKGWTEALQLMKVGSKWHIVVPSALAYGPSGKPPKIEGNAALIFDIELLSIQEPAAAPADSAQAISGDIIKVPSQDEMKKGAKIEVIKDSSGQSH